LAAVDFPTPPLRARTDNTIIWPPDHKVRWSYSTHPASKYTAQIRDAPWHKGASDGLLLFNIGDRVLDGNHLLGVLLGDFDVERLLESHPKLDRVEAIGAEVVDKGGAGSNPGLIDTHRPRHDRLHLVGYFGHGP